MAERELAIVIRAKDLASKSLKNVRKEVRGIAKEGGRGLSNVAGNLTKLGVAAAGIGVAGLAGAVKVAADFESQLNIINTVAAKSPEELAKIGEGIRKMARETGAPLADLTQGFYDLVSAGIEASQAQRVLAASNTLAIGGLATAAEGVDLITTALNSYGVAAKDQGRESERFADIFAKAVERGKVTAAELAATFAQVGPLANTMGIEIEELAAGYAQMTAKGVPAAEAATQMNSAMVAFLRKTGPLKKLEKQTGRNYAAIAGRKGLAAAYEQLGKDAEKAGVPLIELVGRKEALQFALATTGDAMKGYTANLDAMQNAEGTAARQMAERQKGLNFQLDKLKANVIDAGIVIGSKLIPKLVPLAERMVKFLQSHEPDIERFGTEIAKGFDKAVQFAEKIPWAAIGSGLKTAADWAGKLMDAFLKLPPQAQATIVALAGLNKLSGGAISGIVGELGKGLIKGVLGMTAGVVNIKAGVVTGAGGGLPGAAGGAAGPAGIGARALVAGGAAAAVVGLLQEASKEAAKALNTEFSKVGVGANFQGAQFGPQGILPGIQNLAEAIRVAGELFGRDDRGHEAGGRTRGPTGPRSSQDNDPDSRQWRNEKLEAAVNKSNTHIEKLRLGIGKDLSNHGSKVTTATKAGAIAAGLAARLAGDRTAAAARAAGVNAAASSRSAGATTAAAARSAGVTAKSGGVAAAVAIRNKRWRINVPVTINNRTIVSIRDQVQAHYKVGRYGHVSEFG